MSNFPSSGGHQENEVQQLNRMLGLLMTDLSGATDPFTHATEGALVAQIRHQLAEVLEAVFWMECPEAAGVQNAIAPYVQTGRFTMHDIPSLTDTLMEVYMQLPVSVPAPAQRGHAFTASADSLDSTVARESRTKELFPAGVSVLQSAIVEFRYYPDSARTEKIRIALESLLEILPHTERYDDLRAVLASSRNRSEYTNIVLQRVISDVAREWAALA